MSDNYLLHKRILVVDDEQALLDMICSILQAYGFQNTTTAKSVREALMEAEKCPPELAILDVMLPDGNGFDLMTLVQLQNSQIDFARAEVIKSGMHIPLTAKEHRLLWALYRNAGCIVTIDALCEAVWGDNPFGYENSLMAHIRRIREKIEQNPSQPVSLVTIKGLGYKLNVEGR